MEGKVIQYSWEKEKNYPPGRLHGPRVGHKWAYFPVDWEQRAIHSRGEQRTLDTEGPVETIDWESGVITTSAGEILIRG